ncbi:Dcp1p-Dcp2p decapping enzyme complex alpha subunit [Recurvomyces mirabilis]|uniref:mRNA-capping enzyme subunit alpha n=1 Tax=Recurvomyces mirabilis TaxID=574656 RepID=A0AAE1C304_9PEZI|nr:Dcp1p-Dcp2p decapping enzyme complex alpha subunit [Recurvomyces mirabilis]KAK5154017.1 Dcp1p-Dcp2p decapping enzyme complex alpha subunit [Recurvomyces mirabilis]
MGSSVNLSDIGTRLQNPDLKWQQEQVADLLHRQSLAFPGAQPVSFSRHHIHELQQRDYFMCEKTDGIRCLLYLTQFVNEDGQRVEVQFLIDRKNDYYYIPRDALHIPTPPPEGVKEDFDVANFHLGTLLDGELVLQRLKEGGQRLAYLMFDILALDGESVMNKPFDRRLARLQQQVARPYRKFTDRYPEDAKTFPFQPELKAMELPYGTEMMFKDRIPNLPHGNDGLIFTCVGTEYVSGTDQHILKWKPPHENTIDFRLVLGDFPMLEDEDGTYPDWDACPDLELHVNHGDSRSAGSGTAGGYHRFANLTLTPPEWTAFKSLQQPLDGRIIECYRDPATGHWRPKIEDRDGTPRFRDDKTDANHISTVNSVLQSIEDAVGEGDLIEAAGRIKKGYKRRQAEKVEGDRRAAEEERKRRREGQMGQGQGQGQGLQGRGQGGGVQQQQGNGQVRREESLQAKVVVGQEEEDDDGPRYDDE